MSIDDADEYEQAEEKPKRKKATGEPHPEFIVGIVEDGGPLPDACPKCKSRLSWWNVLGQRFCLLCTPPRKSRELLIFKKKFTDAVAAGKRPTTKQ